MPTKTLCDTDSIQTLTNKTLTSPSLATPTVTGALTLGAGQIVFPAVQSASAGVNTLDDYEEGTWTPSLGGTTTYTTQIGTYTKIGRAVYVHLLLTINTIGSGSTGTISGLPFTNGVSEAPVFIGAYSSLANSVTALFGRVNSGTTTMTLTGPAAAATANTGVTAIFGNSTTLSLSTFYFV